jgi:hypothetical protein
MAVEGDTLFVASKSGLSAYDISDPANPAESWSTDIDGLTSILGHADSLWMTHAPAGGLSVMDLTGSPDPGAVSLFEIERAYTSLAGSGGNLLVALEATQYGQSDAPVRLHVLGAAWPGRVSTSEFSQQTPVAAADVALLGDTLLVADPATGLLVLDAGEPGTELGRLELPGGARFVEAGRSWAAVVDAWTHAPDLGPGHPGHGDPVHRMHLVDLADPTSPRVADEVVAGYNPQVEAVGARVLLWAEGVASLYDVAPDTRFTPRGSLTYDAGSGYAHAALQGDFVYVATNSKLMVADVSDPDAPRWVAEVPFEPGLKATAIAVSGRLAAVGLTESSGGRVRFGARLFDISNPERPVTVRDELGEQGDVFASLTAYEERLIAVGWTSVKQWDVSDFSWVKQVALMEAAGSPYRPADPGGNPTVPGFGPGPVVVDGGRAWMAAGGAGVLAADLPEGRLDVKIALPAVMTKR